MIERPCKSARMDFAQLRRHDRSRRVWDCRSGGVLGGAGGVVCR